MMFRLEEYVMSRRGSVDAVANVFHYNVEEVCVYECVDEFVL